MSLKDQVAAHFLEEARSHRKSAKRKPNMPSGYYDDKSYGPQDEKAFGRDEYEQELQEIRDLKAKKGKRGKEGA